MVMPLDSLPGFNAEFEQAKETLKSTQDDYARLLVQYADMTTSLRIALTEGLNNKIEAIKRNACGYRNKANFRTAILFHCGKLDLLPH